MNKTNRKLKTWKYDSVKNELINETLIVIVEQSVDLVVNDRILLTFFCSPLDLDALALGFLWNEGIISGLDEIQSLSINSSLTRVDIIVENATDKPQRVMRASSGATLMGQSEIGQLDNPFIINADVLVQLYDNFSTEQHLHKSAGGYHSAALSDGEKVNIIVEDLGRHNCVDKISGRFLLDGRSFTPQVVLLSGRISSEMIHKVLRLMAPIIVSRTTPTARAVDIADTYGITIVGYLRGQGFSIFTHPERIRI